MAFSFYSRWYVWRRALGSFLGFYWRYRPNRLYLLSAFIVQIALWFFAYQIFVAVGQDLFVAHYNVDFGIDSIGDGRRVFSAPLLALAVIVLNFLLTAIFARRKHFHFLSHAFGLLTIFTQVLAALVLMSLYLINFLA